MAATRDDNLQQHAFAIRRQGARTKGYPSKQYRQHAQNTSKQPHQHAQGNTKCGNCGNSHSRQSKCPAQGKQCHYCKKWNHYMFCCHAKKDFGSKPVLELNLKEELSSDEVNKF